MSRQSCKQSWSVVCWGVAVLGGVLLSVSGAAGQVITVASPGELRTALASLQPGSTLRIAAGEYPGGYQVRGVDDLRIEAVDRDQPPHFHGGGTAWQFSQCNRLMVQDLRISGQTRNGINIDDGSQPGQPTVQVTLQRLSISDIGPMGNHDGIKCSGIQDLSIRDCQIEGWGGQGIDLVGCQRVTIIGCRLIGKPGFGATAGVQTKGGSSQVTVAHCLFQDAGQRPVNVGGSTGLDYFRPSDATAEASDITIRDNTIVGSLCAAAFVGVDGAVFSGNTVLYPQRWIFRILQESKDPRFVRCRNVVIENNRIVYRSFQVATAVNVGSDTQPDTFRFHNNHWLAIDQPEAGPPALPGTGIHARPIAETDAETDADAFSGRGVLPE